MATNPRTTRKTLTSRIGSNSNSSRSVPSATKTTESSTIKKKQASIAPEKNIEEQPFYHGYRSRAEVESLLKIPGQWLIRATEGRTNTTELVISLLSNAKTVKNLTLKYDQIYGKWELGVLSGTKKARRFDTVYDLVIYYKNHGLPGNHQMLEVVNRGIYYVRHSSIKYDPAKDFLGNGNFCDVYRAKFEKAPGIFADVAVKVCRNDPNETPQTAQEMKEAMQALVREGNIMQHYSHENVIKFFGIVYDQKPIMIVMEYACGSLDNHLKKQKENIEVGERLMYCFEAANGMAYLHSQKCIHRDLAARNCLISHIGTIKIADFGLSDIHNVNEKQAVKQQVPLRWMAPESLVRNPVYSRKTDVWSYGVLCYEIFNLGEKPWPDEEAKKIATMIRRCNMPELPSTMPPEVKSLMGTIWTKLPESRPDFKKILEDLYGLLMSSCSPPAPEKFSVNKLPGVKRCAFNVKLQDVKYKPVDVNRAGTETETRTKESGLDDNELATVAIGTTIKPVIPNTMLFDPPSTMTALAACQEDYVHYGPPVMSVTTTPSTLSSPHQSSPKRPTKSSGSSASKKRNHPHPRNKTLKE